MKKQKLFQTNQNLNKYSYKVLLFSIIFLLGILQPSCGNNSESTSTENTNKPKPQLFYIPTDDGGRLASPPEPKGSASDAAQVKETDTNTPTNNPNTEPNSPPCTGLFSNLKNSNIKRFANCSEKNLSKGESSPIFSLKDPNKKVIGTVRSYPGSSKGIITLNTEGKTQAGVPEENTAYVDCECDFQTGTWDGKNLKSFPPVDSPSSNSTRPGLPGGDVGIIEGNPYKNSNSGNYPKGKAQPSHTSAKPALGENTVGETGSPNKNDPSPGKGQPLTPSPNTSPGNPVRQPTTQNTGYPGGDDGTDTPVTGDSDQTKRQKVENSINAKRNISRIFTSDAAAAKEANKNGNQNLKNKISETEKTHNQTVVDLDQKTNITPPASGEAPPNARPPGTPVNPDLEKQKNQRTPIGTEIGQRVARGKSTMAAARQFVQTEKPKTSLSPENQEKMLDGGDLLGEIADIFASEGNIAAAENALRALNTAAGIAIGFVPIVGDALDLVGAITGFDTLSNQPLEGWERWAALAGALVPNIIEKAAKNTVSIIDVLRKAAINSDDAGRVARELIDNIEKLAKNNPKIAGDIADADKRMVKILERIPKSAQGNIKEYIDGIKKMSEGKMTKAEVDKFLTEVGGLERKDIPNGFTKYYEPGSRGGEIAEIHPKGSHPKADYDHVHINTYEDGAKKSKRLDGNLSYAYKGSEEAHFKFLD